MQNINKKAIADIEKSFNGWTYPTGEDFQTLLKPLGFDKVAKEEEKRSVIDLDDQALCFRWWRGYFSLVKCVCMSRSTKNHSQTAFLLTSHHHFINWLNNQLQVEASWTNNKINVWYFSLVIRQYLPWHKVASIKRQDTHKFG